MEEYCHLALNDLDEIKVFIDTHIGQDYFTQKDLQRIYRQSWIDEVNCSWVLKINKKIEGIRFTLPPGKWHENKGKGLSIERWPYSIEETAYFQTVLINPKFSGKGFGGELSQKSLEQLKNHGVMGVVCHSWKESPNNSSLRYLEKLNFHPIQEYPGYWSSVIYDCVICGAPPCQCTAVEMYLSLR